MSSPKVYRLLILEGTIDEVLNIVEESVNSNKNTHAIVYRDRSRYKVMYINRDSSPYPLSSTLLVLPVTHKLNISYDLVSELTSTAKDFIDEVDDNIVLVHMVKRVSNELITSALLSRLNGHQELLLNYYTVEGVDNS